MNLWDMAMKGGWIMLVLALLSVVCFYIFFERMAVIRKAGKDDPLFMERIRDYIRTGEIKSAINYCRITNTPSARMIEKGITRMGRPVADVQAAIENSGNIEVAKLENGLPVVATIAGGAPMIGFLGTVTGMAQPHPHKEPHTYRVPSRHTFAGMRAVLPSLSAFHPHCRKQYRSSGSCQ